MYFDGALKLGDGGAVLFISPKGEQLKYLFQILLRSPTMKPSTRHYCMGYAWQSP
jgi:hypothetical protein